MKKKEPKKKPYKSAWSNAIWSFREFFKYVPAAFVMRVLQIPLNVFYKYGEIYLPALVVAEVTGNETLSHATLAVGGFLALMLLADIVRRFMARLSDCLQLDYVYKESEVVTLKVMNCLYQDYEKKEVRDLAGRARETTEMWNGVQPIADMPNHSLSLIENCINYILFGSMISFASPWLVPILTIAPVVNWFCAKLYRNWEYSNRGKVKDVNSKLWYVQNMPNDFSSAKDIRVYGMSGWFQSIYNDLCKERFAWDKKRAFYRFLSQIADLLVILIRDGAAYALLIAMILAGEITIDEFVLYFAAISSFAGFVGNIMNAWNKIHSVSLSVCDFREFTEMEEWDGTGTAQIEMHLGKAPRIVFEHVSFRHDGAETDTLHDINLCMEPGEKIALVGLNGAGKTTLVKLLCGLYLPTEGDIKINGVSFREFRRKDYYKLFSPVFQTIETGYFSFAETVSGHVGGMEGAPYGGKSNAERRKHQKVDEKGNSGMDMQRVEHCLRLAGLGDKIDSLPLGIHTKLDKQVNEDGIELSGGEIQKLMLARALYKDAPALVLDELTAALDPIAEHKIYTQYQDMTENKTALFISHRLASTQFCDRILYLKNGEIAEEGTHSELMAKGGDYSELYELQSCWYHEDYESENDGGETAQKNVGEEEKL